MGLFDALFGNKNQFPTVTSILPSAARDEIMAGRLPILNTDKLFLKRGERIHAAEAGADGAKTMEVEAITAEAKTVEREAIADPYKAEQKDHAKKNDIKKDYTEDEASFAVFCIENVAIVLNVDAALVYDAWTKDSDILDGYIIPCYESLHTQGKEYIVQDLLALMKERGIAL